MKTLMVTAMTTGMALGIWTPASAANDPASAFGLAASGPVAIPALPSVTSADGGTSRLNLVTHSTEKLVKASVLKVVAKEGRARSSAAGVDALDSAITADAVAARCSRGAGSTKVAGMTVGGTAIDLTPAANTTVPLRVAGLGTASVTLNKQVRHADGSLTVTGLALAIPLGGGRSESINLASVTCGGRQAPRARTETTTVTEAVAPKDSILDKVADLPKAEIPVPANVKLPVAG
ncbi:choice-of-anchor P family protein [Nonomuraea sp. NPDC050556]|uniref:choice-of-anchor P family protein n=1 Tax=Nonomuraea sp. NPDC050556 TaxID=3364369 RepID=UPI0037B814D2